MAIYHPRIKYRNQTNYDHELVVATFEGGSNQEDSYLAMEPVYSDSYNGTQRIDYGAKFSDVARPYVTFIDVDGKDISPAKVRRVLKWLTGFRDNSWMDVIDKDGNTICSYLGRFTDVKLQKMDARVIGIVAQFTSINPWAYSKTEIISIAVNGNTEFPIENLTDDLDSYIYPRVKFTNNTQGGEFILTNTTTGAVTRFNNLQAKEVITIDSNFIAHSNDVARIFNEDFNFNFPALVHGVNNFIANGNGNIEISFRYPMKVVDGLMNAQDLYDSLVIFVEYNTDEKGHRVKIRGDVNNLPPNGVNMKVNNTRLIVRGDFDNVIVNKADSMSNIAQIVLYGTLILDEEGKECPFDEFDADVIDGALTIHKDLSKVDIKE